MLLSKQAIPEGQWFFNTGLHGQPHLRPTPCLTWVGRDHVIDPHYNFDGLQREQEPFVIFQLTLAGEGKLSLNGKSYTCREGDFFIIPVPHDHRYYLPKSSAFWDVLYINLTGKLVMEQTTTFVKNHKPHFHMEENSKLMDIVLEIFKRAQNDDKPSPYEESSLAWSLLMNVFDLSLQQNHTPKDHWLNAVRHHVLKHCSEPLEVKDLAKQLGYSTFHFSRKFKQLSKTSPSEYIRNTRLEMAKQILSQKRLSIKELTYLVGFQEQSHFGKCFKAKYGLSPKAYQKKFFP